MSRSRDEQVAHAARGGFCARHTWQYEKLASAKEVCTSYILLLQDVARRLASLVEATESLPDLVRAIVEMAPKRADCKACQAQATAEEEAIESSLGKLQNTSEGKVPLLCLPHLHRLLGRPHAIGIAKKVLEQQARVLEETAANMQRFALKQDALRRDLFSEEEQRAGEQGLMLLVGHKRV